MGAWSVVSGFVEEVAEQIGAKHPEPRYAGRPTSASPATGSAQVHAAEQAVLLEEQAEFAMQAQRSARASARQQAAAACAALEEQVSELQDEIARRDAMVDGYGAESERREVCYARQGLRLGPSWEAGFWHRQLTEEWAL